MEHHATELQKHIEMTRESLDAVLEKLSPEEREELVRGAISKTKPRGWSSGTNAPYYRESFAREVELIINTLEQDREHDITIPAKTHKLSTKSLYQKFVQAFMYLVAHLDIQTEEHPEGKYKWMREHISISKKDPGVVRFSWKHKPQADLALIAASMIKVDKAAKVSKWRSDFQEFVDTAENDTIFERRGLDLTTEDIDYIASICDAAADTLHVMTVTKTQLKVVKKIF
jgi:hypothetical protein